MGMRWGVWLSCVATAALLAGCGGGGGGTRPDVTPPPPSPAPQPQPEPPLRPQPIHHLKENQTFNAIVASSKVLFNREYSNFETMSEGRASTGTFSVSYNAGAKSYTLVTPDYLPTFQPAESVGSDGQPFARHPFYVGYTKPGKEQGWDLLLLFKTSLDGKSETQHVGLGQWRQLFTLPHNDNGASFHTFVYGYESPASAVPRTGTGSFRIDVFGIAATPGFEAQAFEGIGRFDIDFGAGSFSTYARLIESFFLSGFPYGGPGHELSGTGKLSGTDGTFSGQITYGGRAGTIPGTLNGRFYGPDASELGAVISADNGKGTTISGGLIGWRSENLTITNQNLLNIAVPELFLADGVYLYFTPNGFPDIEKGTPYRRNVGLLLRPQGIVEVRYWGGSNIPDAILPPDAIVTSDDPNFTVYDKTIKRDASTRPKDRIRLELYKPGQANTELQLTYTSFGRWQNAPEGTDLADGDRLYFTYGFKTPESALAARTGSAHYSGVAYGAGYNKDTQTRYEVSGTSRFDVNFSDKTFAGGLVISGKTTGSASPVDFGTYSFGGALGSSNKIEASMTRADRTYGYSSGRIAASFNGPNAEEIGGTFTVGIEKGEPGGGTNIGGVIVAKQR